MMNANVPLESLAAAMPPGDALRGFTVVFYYYTFIALHFFMLLNLVIAMVVDAYIDVQTTNKAVVASTLKNNMGALHHDIYDMCDRYYVRVERSIWRMLSPKYREKDEHRFIAWGNDKWLALLTEVVEERKKIGVPSFALTLTVVAANIRQLHKRKMEMGFPHGVDPKLSGTGGSSTGNRRASLPRGMTRKGLTSKGVGVPKAGDKVEGSSRISDYALRQCVKYMFERPHFIMPANLERALSDKAQPANETWHDMTLQKISNQVAQIERRSLNLELNVAALADATEVLTEMSAETFGVDARSSKGDAGGALASATNAGAPAPSDAEGRKVRRRRSKSRERKGDSIKGSTTAAAPDESSPAKPARRSSSNPRSSSTPSATTTGTGTGLSKIKLASQGPGWGRDGSSSHMADV